LPGDASNRERPDAMLLSLGWGALWGLALGMWLLAPAVIDAHQLRPEGPNHWILVLGALSAIFAVLGAVFGFVGGFVLSVIEKLIVGSFLDRSWAYALFTGITAPTVYAADSIAVHWKTYGGLDFPPPVLWGLATFCVASAIATAVGVAAYRAMTTRIARLRPVTLCRALSTAAVIGALAVLLPTSSASSPSVEVGSLQRLPSRTDDVPLLFIGIDGASWRVLTPAMENGVAPTLQRLVERGTTGTMDGLWPPYWSGAAWAAILTGLPRETTGVYEDLAASAPGFPLFQAPFSSSLRLNPVYSIRSLLLAGGIISYTPPPRPLLKGKPIWQLLHEAGVRSAVVRFRFTYPPQGQADIVVSDWVGNDQWERMGVQRRQDVEAIIPHEQADQLLTPFRSREPADPALFGRLLPGSRPRKPADARLDPITELEIASDVDTRTLNVSESILRTDPTLPFLAIYIGGLDSVQHGFWQYRFPDDFENHPPARSDIERLGPVPDNYVRYLDERLNRLLALYAREPNVVIVSDHGFGPTTIPSNWRGWHAREGIFIAAGPSVPHRTKPVSVSYYDVVPTIARLKGFREPDVVHGRALVPDVSRD
jgi:predicted AlkP superfamily phosphohydrolase/phosphomutase